MQKKRDRREYMKKWHLAHKETENAGSREYYAKNRKACMGMVKDWQNANPAWMKEWRHKRTMENLEDNLNKIRTWKIEEKTMFVNAYGGCCTCCGETEMRFLTCEHLIRGQGKEDKKGGWTGPRLYRRIRFEGYPKDRYTVLCMNCNFARKQGKPCPHESDKEGLREVAG